ncbi:hypothetical protein F4678DRAFT_462817 [Xylaria arbuscula]|nr:hypothetical protein F4678DRAFT_462817 [Xylaria arbuscula]
MSNSTLYLGVWTNWSCGSILGSTLTTTKENGNLLISFTAIFIGFAASRLWKILFLLHRYYSTVEPRGAVHHQRQVILRNSPSPEAGLFDIVRMLGAWRKSKTRRIIVLLLLALFSVTYLISFTVADGFSSTISTAVGDEVLIGSATCGPLLENGTIGAEEIIARFYVEALNNAANYAQQCYSGGNSNDDRSSTMACNKFVVKSLPTAMANFTSECPFSPAICRNSSSSPRLDSGYIGSNNDLGLSAPQSARLPMRYVLQCSPLEIKGYTSHLVEYNRRWDRYHYANETQGVGRHYLYEIEDINSHKLNALYGVAPLFNFTSENLDPIRPYSSSALGSQFIWLSFLIYQYPAKLYTLLGFLRPKALASQSRLNSGIQFPLPGSQRQLDKIRSSQHASFSLFGLLFTFITGALIIVASYVLEPFLGYLYKRRKYEPTRRTRPEHMSKFTEYILIMTGLDDALASFDITDPYHPILQRQFKEKLIDQSKADTQSNSEDQA